MSALLYISPVVVVLYTIFKYSLVVIFRAARNEWYDSKRAGYQNVTHP